MKRAVRPASPRTKKKSLSSRSEGGFSIKSLFPKIEGLTNQQAQELWRDGHLLAAETFYSAPTCLRWLSGRPCQGARGVMARTARELERAARKLGIYDRWPNLQIGEGPIRGGNLGG